MALLNRVCVCKHHLLDHFFLTGTDKRGGQCKHCPCPIFGEDVTATQAYVESIRGD